MNVDVRFPLFQQLKLPIPYWKKTLFSSKLLIENDKPLINVVKCSYGSVTLYCLRFNNTYLFRVKVLSKQTQRDNKQKFKQHLKLHKWKQQHCLNFIFFSKYQSLWYIQDISFKGIRPLSQLGFCDVAILVEWLKN